MTKVGIIGAAGRMGCTLVRCLHEGIVEGLALSAANERSDHPQVGKDAGVLSGVGELGIQVTGDLQATIASSDVLIDFSFHTATAEHASQVASAGKPLVVGTTGLMDDEKALVAKASESIPIVMAPNMSLGINLLLSLVEQTARALKGKGYDIEIIERHHRRKKDAPSGTALALGESAAAGTGWNLGDVAVDGREGIASGERPDEQIGFHAVRGGDFVGDHTVVFAADGESVELHHRATRREAFAVGALRAAAWVANRPAGLYSMQDVLGVRGPE